MTSATNAVAVKLLFCEILSATEFCSVLDRTTVCRRQNNILLVDMTIQNADKQMGFQRFGVEKRAENRQKVNAGECKCKQHTPDNHLNSSSLTAEVKG